MAKVKVNNVPAKRLLEKGKTVLGILYLFPLF